MTTPLTLKGSERLKEELRRLKQEERPKIVNAISEARAHGDLSENAEYHAAREQQGFLEGRIATLEALFANAHIVDPADTQDTDRVVFGATVVLASVQDSGSVRYQIVGEEEANIDAGRISITSPIARALIGHQQGDEVQVLAPAGERIYEIEEIIYE